MNIKDKNGFFWKDGFGEAMRMNLNEYGWIWVDIFCFSLRRFEGENEWIWKWN